MLVLVPLSTLPLLAGWILLANHTHTQASPDSTLRVADLDLMAKDKGVHAVVITDHDTVRAVLDPVFHATSSVRFIEGEEWGYILGSNFVGHIGLIGLRGDIDVAPTLRVDEALGQAVQRGALAVINHPFNWVLSWRGKEIPSGAGGVEVWNQSWNDLTMRNDLALRWWDEGLRAGRRLVAVGGADVHGIRIGDRPFFPNAIDEPINRVWSADTSTAAIMEGLHAGRVVIARDARSPIVEVFAPSGGVVKAMIGDEVKSSGRSPIEIMVRGGMGHLVSLHTRAGKVFEKLVESSDQTMEVPADLSPDGDFARVELREAGQGPNAPMVAMTNPIYFRP